MRRKTAVIWIVLSLFCLSACQQTADSSLTDSSIQTEDTVEEVSGSSHITTETPAKNDTTVPNTSDTTSSDTTITGTTTFHFDQRVIQFSTIDELKQFMTAIDEAKLQDALAVKLPGGDVYFEKSRFTMLLEDHFYLMPVLPDSYRFLRAQISTVEDMLLTYTDIGENRYDMYIRLRSDKLAFVIAESFTRSDGIEVKITHHQDGTGVYSWEKDAYQCYIYFSKENMSMTRTFVNNLRMEKIMIA